MGKEMYSFSRPQCSFAAIGHIDDGNASLAAAITGHETIDKAPEAKTRGIAILMARTGLPLLAVLALSACSVELNTSIDNSAAEEAQVRAVIARQIEDHPGFSTATGVAPNVAAPVKAAIVDATISGPNYSFSASGRALFCVEIAYAGAPPDAPRRPAKAEVAMRGSTGSLILASTTISEERCTGSAAPQRFEELIALRNVSAKR